MRHVVSSALVIVGLALTAGTPQPLSAGLFGFGFGGCNHCQHHQHQHQHACHRCQANPCACTRTAPVSQVTMQPQTVSVPQVTYRDVTRTEYRTGSSNADGPRHDLPDGDRRRRSLAAGLGSSHGAEAGAAGHVPATDFVSPGAVSGHSASASGQLPESDNDGAASCSGDLQRLRHDGRRGGSDLPVSDDNCPATTDGHRTASASGRPATRDAATGHPRHRTAAALVAVRNAELSNDSVDRWSDTSSRPEVSGHSREKLARRRFQRHLDAGPHCRGPRL